MRATSTALLALSLLAIAACGSNDEPRFRPRASAQDHGAQDHGAAADRAAPPSTTVRVAPPPSTAVVPAPPPPITGGGSGAPLPADPRLMDPAALHARAPATFAVELSTTEGPIIIDVTRAWSPNGADRFYNLVQNGFFTDVAFFRVISGFMAQCGIAGNPAVARAWQHASIPDDPTGVQHNTRGFVSFATGGPNTRTTQFFINLVDNSRLDGMGFTPFGRVRDMTHVDALYNVYGEGAPAGHGPTQGRIQSEGNTYLRAEFPELDYIQSARVL
jgi:peptidyl-prolyl cis-trans isomerase A (cyclophilin A)